MLAMLLSFINQEKFILSVFHFMDFLAAFLAGADEHDKNSKLFS